MDKPYELVEEYNREGVCVKRTINGYELPPDVLPSVQIFVDRTSLTHKFYMTPEETKHKYGYLPINPQP